MSSTRDTERYRKIYSFYRPRPRAAAPVYAAGGGAACSSNGLTITGQYACAENDSNTASGDASFAIGFTTTASGYASFSFGSSATASGVDSCAGGDTTIASGYASNAIGFETIASGDLSHAEGSGTQAGVFPGDNFYASHAEGIGSIADGKGSHAEGFSHASGSYSHAEGGNAADGGGQTFAIGIGSHAEGGASHAGACMFVCTATSGTIVINSSYGDVSSAFVALDSALILNQAALFGRNGSTEVIQSVIWSTPNTIIYTNNDKLNITSGAVVAYNDLSHVSGTMPGSQTWGLYSHAEGALGVALGIGSHAEGTGIALGDYSHAEGYSYNLVGNFGYAGGTFSHAEGFYNKAFGDASHAEGASVQALGSGSHAEGYGTSAAGFADHAEGYGTFATGRSFSGIQGPGSGSITLAAVYGNVTSLFVAGRTFFARAPDLLTSTAAYGTIIDSYWNGVNTIVLWGQETIHGPSGELMVIPIDTPMDDRGDINNGIAAHAAGSGSISFSLASHAEGISTISVSQGSHSEGNSTISAQSAGHAEGLTTHVASAIANYGAGHAEGMLTTVITDTGHAEGSSTTAGSVWYKAIVLSGSYGGTGSLVIHENHGNVTGSFSGDDFIYLNNNVDMLTAGRSYQVRPTMGSAYFNGVTTRIEITDYNIELLGASVLAVGSGHTLTSINSTTPFGSFCKAPDVEYAPLYGLGAHAEGVETAALVGASHAEGYKTTAMGSAGHAEGIGSRAVGIASHAEGLSTVSSGQMSHAEGGTNDLSYITGLDPTTEAYGNVSHAEGVITVAYGLASHAEGYSTRAGSRAFSIVGSVVAGLVIIDQKYKDQTLNFVPGTDITLIDASENVTIRSVVTSTFPGSTATNIQVNDTNLNGTFTSISILAPVTVPGRDITGIDIPEADLMLGAASHAEGIWTVSAGAASHAEGIATIASGKTSHSEGFSTIAAGLSAHSEGYLAIATGDYAHAEGYSTKAIGSGSHAGGYETVASGSYQTVVGKFNEQNNTHSTFIVGKGASLTNRSDVFRIEPYGAQISGSLIVRDGASFDSELRNTGSLGTDNYFYVSGSIRRGIESTSNFRSVLAGDLICSGSVSLRSGTLGSTGNGPVGKITLDAATPSKATVTNSTVKATSVVILTKQTNNHSQSGSLVINSLSAGSFQIMSNLAGDTDTVGYLIINVVP